jgi:IS5 family transposase
MAFRIQSNASPDAFDAVIAGAPCNATLSQLDALIDWARIRKIFASVYDPSGRGQLGFDPVVLYKMLLLEELYALSDVQVAIEAGDRISFRRFLGLGVWDTPPDDTTLVRFRQRVRTGGLLDKARREVERQLAKKAVRIRTGSVKVVDATLVPAATRPPQDLDAMEENVAETAPVDATGQPAAQAEVAGDAAESVAEQAPAPAPDAAPAKRSKLDRDARFGGKQGKLKYGYKLHAAIDTATGAIEEFRVTPANVADTTVFAQLLEDEEVGVLADKGYDSATNREALGKRGALDGIMRRVGKRAKAVLGAMEAARNKALSKLRSPFEGTFAALKRWRRMGRAIYVGLARVEQQVQLAVTVHNALKLLKLQEECAQ